MRLFEVVRQYLHSFSQRYPILRCCDMLLGGIERFLEIQFKPRVSLARPLIHMQIHESTSFDLNGTLNV